MANKKDPFADAYPPGEKPPEDMDSLMNDMTAPKKMGKMPNFSKSNKGSYAKKKAEAEGGTEDKLEEQPLPSKSADPSDDIPIKSMANKKDPFADAYPPGEKPPEDMDSLMNDISAPKKMGKMPNFSKSNKGSHAAKKKAAEEGNDASKDVEMSEQPLPA